jgi:predicted MPP superfamily phosphohydrolase
MLEMANNPAPPELLNRQSENASGREPSRAEPRRSRMRRSALLVVVVLGCAAAVDGFLVEPNWIEVTRYQARSLSSSFVGAPLKIAHLSDLHTNGVGFRERHLLALLEAEQPDLIVVTGDTVTRGGDPEATRGLLARLHAPLGVWVVRGNWENWRRYRNERAFYASVGVNFLLNEARPVREGVWLVGLDDPASGSPNLKAALRGVPADVFTIAVFHAPAYFHQVAGRCPLALAGHTHGGQVRIPFLPPLWLPPGSGRFLEGWYEEDRSRMYVSRGIGTSILPVRFLCRPELAIITVEN